MEGLEACWRRCMRALGRRASGEVTTPHRRCDEREFDFFSRPPQQPRACMKARLPRANRTSLQLLRDATDMRHEPHALSMLPKHLTHNSLNEAHQPDCPQPTVSGPPQDGQPAQASDRERPTQRAMFRMRASTGCKRERRKAEQKRIAFKPTVRSRCCQREISL
jgi:hypothetical protein